MSKKLKYNKLVDIIKKLIDDGVLKPGDSLPSIRQFSKQQNTSTSTVLKAYHTLEDRNIIMAKARSGFIVLPNQEKAYKTPEPIDFVVESQPVTLSEWNRYLFNNLPKHTALSFRGPFPNTLNSAQLNRTLCSVVRRKAIISQYYTHPQGYELLRDEIVKRGVERGVISAAKDILITSGGTEALALALRATTKPGDTVAIESPAYYGLLYLLEDLQLNAIEVPTSINTGISLDVLETLCKGKEIQACVFTANIHMPLGFIMPLEKKKALAKLAEYYKIPIIENDAMGELVYGDDINTPVKAFDHSGYVLYCNSFSKTIAAGYRVGWINPGEIYHDKILSCKLSNSLSAASPTQLAISEYLQMGYYSRHLKAFRQYILDAQIQTRQAIYDYFPEGIRVSTPKGGVAIWIQLPKHIDATVVCREAFDQKIFHMPGSVFTLDDKYRNYFRINASSWSEQTIKDIKVLSAIIQKYW